MHHTKYQFLEVSVQMNNILVAKPIPFLLAINLCRINKNKWKQRKIKTELQEEYSESAL